MPSPVILITGAARRVGAEIARTLHAAGANIALHYRSSRSEAEQLAQVLNTARPDSAFAVAADLSDSPALPALVSEVVRHFGHLDGLVNNASSFFATPVGNIDEASWQELMGSNLKGPLFLSQVAAPYLAQYGGQGGGAIVNITDIHAERPLKGYAVYSSAKAGLAGLTRALAIELAPQVRVNAVAPGAIVWPEDSSFSATERDAIIAHTPLQRMGSPEDIARTVKFLLFDAPFITGQIINVDGGRSIHI
jgi:pteridine reductase